MDVDLTDRIAVVAGPDGGLRQAIAQRLIASGATVKTAAAYRAGERIRDERSGRLGPCDPPA